MDLEPLLNQMPRDDAAALRLRIAGQPNELIACALGIDAEHVPNALQSAGVRLVHVAVATANARV